MSASSEWNERTAQDGWLHSGTAWSAKESDFSQFIMFDLGRVMNITAIVTQGRAHSEDFVEEYRIQYGTNGRDFADYKEVDGFARLFNGNTDGFAEVRNVFDQPIIAQFVKINPTRWADKIAMRIELYGCDYISDVIYFDGNSMLKRDLQRYPISSRRELIRFRFKTNKANGVLLYSRGTQEDYMALQLVESRILLNINLGAMRRGTTKGESRETSITLGSLLDDNVFHEVYVERNRRDIILSVDRVKIADRIRGEFNKLDLDANLFIGGVPFVQRGLVVYENFTGCIENLYLNHTNVIASFNNKLGIYDRDEYISYEQIGALSNGCVRDFMTIPVTFRTAASYVKQIGYEGTYNFNVSLQFRTFERAGLLVFHKFSSEGHVKLYMEHARIKVQIVATGMPDVVIDNFDQTYNDGIWHTVELSMAKNQVSIGLNH